MLRRSLPNKLIDEVYAVVCGIPPGKVMSYGQVGDQLLPPLSGRVVGRIMYLAPETVPWWRVVGKDGDLRITKRDPRLARLQQRLLQQEGVLFLEDGRVDMQRCQWQPFEEEQ